MEVRKLVEHEKQNKCLQLYRNLYDRDLKKFFEPRQVIVKEAVEASIIEITVIK